MHGSQRHRDQDARAPWTKRQLIVSKCTLYLFIVFSLELRSSAAGEEKSFDLSDGRKSEPTFSPLC